MELYFFLLGTAFGSFNMAAADRIVRKETLFGRSHCDGCRKTLAWFELIPIVSWLMVKGKSRCCNQKLSACYPFFELLSGIIFYLAYRHFLLSRELLFHLLFLTFLYQAALIDSQLMIIPDQYVFAIALLGLFQLGFIRENQAVYYYGAFVVSLPLFLLAAATKGIGYGDVKLMAAAGLYLGAPKILTAMMLASFTGSIAAFYEILVKKRNRRSIIPLAPWLALGITLALFWGDAFLSWYFGLETIALL